MPDHLPRSALSQLGVYAIASFGSALGVSLVIAGHGVLGLIVLGALILWAIN